MFQVWDKRKILTVHTWRAAEEEEVHSGAEVHEEDVQVQTINMFCYLDGGNCDILNAMWEKIVFGKGIEIEYFSP